MQVGDGGEREREREREREKRGEKMHLKLMEIENVYNGTIIRMRMDEGKCK